jgi:hypothetical protein
MMKKVAQHVILCSLLSTIVLIASPTAAEAWTTARLSQVQVGIEVAREGPSTVTTRARYEISGGKFHGFDLAPLDGAGLVEEECSAYLDDGRRYPLSFRKLFDGRVRVVLADKVGLGKGAVNFVLVHRVDLIEQGALRRYGGRARLDWTPLVWDDGTDAMSVEVTLPGPSRDAPVIVDEGVARDYEVVTRANGAMLSKFRTVRWYPMRTVLEFDPELIASLGSEQREEEQEPSVAALGPVASTPPSLPAPTHVLALPLLAVLLGLLAMAYKSWKLGRALADLGIASRFKLLPRTGLATRVVLSLAAAGLGLGAQYLGSLAAGVPAIVVAAALWIVRREEGSLRTRPGGAWRRMGEEDVRSYRKLNRAYRARRRSLVDITTVGGALTFVLALAALGYAVVITRGSWPRIAWALLIDGLIWAIPAWFSHVRSELPVDPTLEGFAALRRWRSSLARLVGTKSPGAEAGLWVREDDKGTIEVRLRLEPPPPGLKGLEVAGEVVRSGSSLRTRRAAILRLEPGTELARRLATCPHAAEHHLTPDLEDEIIVLRNRRGRADAGLAPLRIALGMLPSQ